MKNHEYIRKLSVKELAKLLVSSEEVNEGDEGMYVLTEEQFKPYREALEKQIPKKPIYASIDGFTLPVPYYCPVCGEQIAKYDAYARCLRKEHHCKCGQRIDWSEVNRGGQMKATLTIEVPSRGCHHKCPLCVTAHEPISYEVWYQCKVNKLECTAENCPLEIKEVDE